MNQKIFFVSLEQSKIQEAKKLLNTEDKLIKDYNQNIKKIHFEYRIPDKWKQKFVDTYTKMHLWNKKYFEAKNQNNEGLHKKLVLKGKEVFDSIPFIESTEFMNELEKIICDTPLEIINLNQKSLELATKAYELYFIQKYKIGEEPVKF